MATTTAFTVGRDVQLIGRWLRLIAGGLLVAGTVYQLSLASVPLAFYLHTTFYFVIVVLAYTAAHYFLGERLFAHTNPWISTLILVGPLIVVAVFQLGPGSFRLALQLYVALSLVLTFFISYGGCEVAAFPSLLWRRRYTVYCPWNVVDVIENGLVKNSHESK